jgi:hypothetical protein
MAEYVFFRTNEVGIVVNAEKLKYEGESNENRKIFFKFNLKNESGTQLYHFST